MGIKAKLKGRALKKASEKLMGGIPRLKQLAIDNDACYNGLMKIIQDINAGRKAKKKYITKTY